MEIKGILNDQAGTPGFVKRQVRVTSRPRLGFMTKNGKTRFVPTERDLMNKLLSVKATKRPTKLLFGTRTGLPDYHMLDTLILFPCPWGRTDERVQPVERGLERLERRKP
jgi:hypothetical protein